MKIKSFAVRNFRAIGPGDGDHFPSSEVTLDPIDFAADRILILGANNGGKSSLMDAYRAFVTSKWAPQIEDFHGCDESNQIVMEVKISAFDEELDTDVTKKWFRNNEAIIRKVWGKRNAEGTKYCWDPQKLCWETGGFGGLDTILQNRLPEPIWIGGFSDPAEIIVQLQSLIKEAVLENLNDRDEYKNAENALTALRDIIEGDKYVDDLSDKIAGNVREFFPDVELRITNPASEKGLLPLFDKQAIVTISAENSPTLPFDRHGHGLQRQLVFSALQGAAAELYHIKLAKSQRKKTAPDSTRHRILLIEEPELFLSPPAVRIMSRLVDRISRLENFQVMAATHSPSIVDLSAPRQTLVRMVRDAGKSSYFQIGSEFFDRDERNTIRAQTLFDSHLSESIFADWVVIVEGASEKIAINTILDRFAREKDDFSLLKLQVATFGGKGEIPLLQRIMRYLRVPYIVVHDTDDPDEQPTDWKANFTIGDEVVAAR